MPAEILNSAHGGNDRYKHFFSADFYDFFAIFKAFFTTSFYGFGTWPKWPLQPLHFGVFGAAVTRYCRIDWNGTVYVLYMQKFEDKQPILIVGKIPISIWVIAAADEPMSVDQSPRADIFACYQVM